MKEWDERVRAGTGGPELTVDSTIFELWVVLRTSQT